jgi:hypothetical protein
VLRGLAVIIRPPFDELAKAARPRSNSQALPPRARVTILTYIEEKLAGLYGHNKTQLRRFATRFDLCNRGHSLFAGNVLVATLAWIIVRLVQ